MRETFFSMPARCLHAEQSLSPAGNSFVRADRPYKLKLDNQDARRVG